MIYRFPGTGSVSFAEQFTEGLTEIEALFIIRQLMKGELHDTDDKRVKRCSYCGYYYRDKTKPNTSKTCSRECKTSRDTLNRAKKKADQELLKPKKKTKREQFYVHWLEYPFWLNEYEMLKQSWKNDVPHTPDKTNRIAAAKERDAYMGGKRKPKRVVPYNGDEKEQPKEPVRFTKSVRTASEVKITHMTAEDIDSYYRSKYSEKRLQQERKRAEWFEKFEKFNRSKKV